MQDINQYVMYLSGGNKQKVSVAKWVGFGADIYIFDCPTRGIDIGVKADIYKLLMKSEKRRESNSHDFRRNDGNHRNGRQNPDC